MSTTIPKHEPESFVAGTTAKWTKTLSDYDSATWTLSYVFTSSGGSFEPDTVSGSGTTYTVTVADTNKPAAGVYHWQATISDGSETYLVGEGTCIVEAKQSTSDAYDPRSHAAKCLDALKAAELGRASDVQLSMSIGGRSISKMSIVEIIQARQSYEAEVARERAAERISNGLGNPLKIRGRF